MSGFDTRSWLTVITGRVACNSRGTVSGLDEFNQVLDFLGVRNPEEAKVVFKQRHPDLATEIEEKKVDQMSASVFMSWCDDVVNRYGDRFEIKPTYTEQVKQNWFKRFLGM